MNKLKWKEIAGEYHAKTKYLSFHIRKGLIKNTWILDKCFYVWETVGCFKKLSSAKKVAQLIHNG